MGAKTVDQKSQKVATPGQQSVHPGKTALSRRAAESIEKAFLERLKRLAAMTESPNWDSENGEVIPGSEWKYALEMYHTTRNWGLPEPFVSPCGDGSIHFRWSKFNRQFKIERRGNIVFWSSKSTAEDFRREQSPNLSDALSRLREFFHE